MSVLTVFLYASLSCPKPEIINHTKTWNTTDKESYSHAQNRCAQKYQKSPCLTKFIKVEFNTYRALCGKKR